MDKTVAGLLTTVAALGLAHGPAAQAAPTGYDAALQAASYADLLTPIPNAQDLLAQAPARPHIVRVQYDEPAAHHHHDATVVEPHVVHRRRHRRHHYVHPAPPPPPVVDHHHHHHHNMQMP